MPPKKVYDCDIEEKTCKGTSSLNKDGVIQLALKCGVISSVEEGQKMSRNLLCQKISESNGGGVAQAPPQPQAQKPVLRKPVPQEQKAQPACDEITDAWCNSVLKAELVQKAIECGAIKSYTEGNRLKKDLLCQKLKEAMGQKPRPPPSSPPPPPPPETDSDEEPPVKPQRPVLQSSDSSDDDEEPQKPQRLPSPPPPPPPETDSDEEPPLKPQKPQKVSDDICYEGKTKSDLKGRKTTLTELKGYAQTLGIKNVDTKDRLAEYICSKAKGNNCSEDENNCGDEEYCDVTNSVCINKSVGDLQVEKSRVKFDSYEHNGKTYIGKVDAIKNLKNKLHRPPTPVISPQIPARPPLRPQTPPKPARPPVLPSLVGSGKCYDGKSREDLQSTKKTTLKQLKEYAQQLGIQNPPNDRLGLTEYICSHGQNNRCSFEENKCNDDEYCDLTNNLCINNETGDAQLENDFEEFEYNDKKYIGNSDAIENFKRYLAKGPEQKPPASPEIPFEEPEPQLVYCVGDKRREDLNALPLTELKKYAKELGIKDIKTKKELVEYLCSLPCDNDYGCPNNLPCDINTNKCISPELVEFRVENDEYVQDMIDNNIIIGKRSDIEKLKQRLRVAPPVLGSESEEEDTKPPAPRPPSRPSSIPPPPPDETKEQPESDDEEEAPVPRPPQQGPSSSPLSEDDIEEILEEITSGKKPVKLQQLSEVERKILACLGIV